MIDQTEVLKKMYELHVSLVLMGNDELEIFTQNNRTLIESLIEVLED